MDKINEKIQEAYDKILTHEARANTRKEHAKEIKGSDEVQFNLFLEDIDDKAQDIMRSLGDINKILNTTPKDILKLSSPDVKNIISFAKKANALLNDLYKKVDLG